ncbi:probable glycosyltransferase STELLO1 [Haliotis rufescens]|uniref:probable glycosyltransferase STELLO1 n=1 Tax=Haliotis rufescens TaxID=6454 RepID=UPI00201FA8C9|nr:probable glycosyltransferase STELLO1 [Haliotis rufescens]
MLWGRFRKHLVLISALGFLIFLIATGISSARGTKTYKADIKKNDYRRASYNGADKYNVLNEDLGNDKSNDEGEDKHYRRDNETLVYNQNSNKDRGPDEDADMDSRHDSYTGKYQHITGDRWIVITTIAYPTSDVRFLAQVPGWKVVVVGDTKTPNDWTLPNCVYLSVEDQRHLGFKTVSLLPTQNYARKNVGYLFAIAHGAKIIYETDDDNRPLDLLENFIQDETTWGLLYNGGKLFNPYRHFGQPSLWPRGYPLSSVGENFSTEYTLSHWKTPSMQQGVVNGDPDMDAIFRLTRKITTSKLNVAFDGEAPPALLPPGVFAPYNSQNTLFLYDALWSLVLPTTVTFRVCDIWRGYMAQRLIWEMGGNLGFFPPNAFQVRNAHSYLKDATEEKDLYFKTERFVAFLRVWTCESSKSFFECMTQLASDMAQNDFWGDTDAKLISFWVQDLKALGYKEPARVAFSQVGTDSKLSKPERQTDQEFRVKFWASEQSPPLIYSTIKEQRGFTSHVSQISSYCRFQSLEVNAVKGIRTYPHLLLIVVFKSPNYQNLQFIETYYSVHFQHIVYCGANKNQFENQANLLSKPASFLEIDIGDRWIAQNCLTQAMKMRYNVEGYLYTDSNILLNTWTRYDLPLGQLWLGNSSVQQQSSSGFMFPNLKDGLEAIVKKFKLPDGNRYSAFAQKLLDNLESKVELFNGGSEIAYVPKIYKQDVMYFVEHFSKLSMPGEFIFPTVFGGIENWKNVHRLTETYLSYDGNSQDMKTFLALKDVLHLPRTTFMPKGRNFFCNTVFPLTLNNH